MSTARGGRRMNLGTIIMAAGMILGELLDSDDEDEPCQ